MKRTLFILGAGASCDFGLPIGTDLAQQIGERMTRAQKAGLGDPLLRSAMNQGGEGNYGAAARDVAGGMVAAPSIDRFLASRQDKPLVQLLGKLGIATSVLKGEAQSPLGTSEDDSWDAINKALTDSRGTWVAQLFRHLHVGYSPSHAADVLKSCAFITFNYDRCIERYLELAFTHVLAVEQASAADIMAKIPILHVYGSLGPLPFQDPLVNVPFGASEGFALDASPNIKTFMEQVESGVDAQISALMEWAELLIVLGFGFDPLNVDRIFSKVKGGQVVRGTLLHVSPKNIQHFRSVLPPAAALMLEEARCAEFVARSEFPEYLSAD